MKDRMNKALEALDRELKTIRTGRANPAILDRISADYYGTQTPIKNMANIGIVDGRTIEIKPFDKGSLKAMEKAIQDSDLGLTPTNDGSRLLISIPDLTKERRQELAKLVKKKQSEKELAYRKSRL
jgi:ribosome recycling factor